MSDRRLKIRYELRVVLSNKFYRNQQRHSEIKRAINEAGGLVHLHPREARKAARAIQHATVSHVEIYRCTRQLIGVVDGK